MSTNFITQLRDNLAATDLELRGVLETATTENRQLTETERSTFDELVGQRAAQAERLAELEAIERRTVEIAQATPAPSVRVGHEARTYNPGTAREGVSYVRDLIDRQLYNDSGAHERLARHAAEVRAETRDISRTDGAGGEFVPPAWLIDQFAEFARAPRVVAELMSNFPMPDRTDSINVPRITTGPQVAPQTADNAAVQETDMVTGTVTAPVRTLAGQQDVSLQLLEQSAVNFDEVVFGELMADYERVLDQQLISGSNASGQLQGVLGLSGIGAITYTDATPTVPEVYPPLHQAVANVLTNRQLPPSAAVTNSRWWSWVAAQLDSSNRPLVVPAGAGPNNAFGSTGSPTNGQLGSMGVVPFFGTTSMPVNLGGGTNETRIVVGRWEDSYLWESEGRTRILPDVGSGTLTVRLQFYRYAAVAHRNPGSYALISGTGLIMPAGY